jgi:Na+-driven multidrug efflux pump
VVTGLLVMALAGLTSGVSILSARHFGMSGLSPQRDILFTFAKWYGGIFVALSVLGYFLAEPLLLLLKTPSDIFELSKAYLQITTIGIPFLAIYNIYGAVLRGIGDSKAPLYSVFVSTLTNIVLDIVFVTVFRWSVRGAAFSTVISQIAMAAYIVLYASRRYEPLRFGNRGKTNVPILKEGFALSLPLAIQAILGSGGNLILQGLLNSFGTTAYRIDSVIMLPIINLGVGISTITSQNLGAGEYERMRKSLSAGTGLMIAVSLSLTALVILFGASLIKLFGVTDASARIGARFFKILGFYYPISGFATVFQGYLEGMGRVRFTSTCNILSLILRIILSYLLARSMGNMAIAQGEAYSWCFLMLNYGAMLLCLQLRDGSHEDSDTRFSHNAKASPSS